MRGSDQVPAPVPQTQTLAPAHYMSSEESIIIEIPSYGSLQLNLRNMQKDCKPPSSCHASQGAKTSFSSARCRNLFLEKVSLKHCETVWRYLGMLAEAVSQAGGCPVRGLSISRLEVSVPSGCRADVDRVVETCTDLQPGSQAFLCNYVGPKADCGQEKSSASSRLSTKHIEYRSILHVMCSQVLDSHESYKRHPTGKPEIGASPKISKSISKELPQGSALRVLGVCFTHLCFPAS